MILDHDRELDDRELADDVDDGGGGEWLSGLRAAGVPVTTSNTAPRGRRAPSPAVQQLIERSLAPGTQEAYRADWRLFDAWCTAHGIDDGLDCDELDVAEYVAALVHQRVAMSTLRRRIAAISWTYANAERPAPTTSRGVRLVLAGAANTLGTHQRRAAPLRLDDLRRLVRAIPIVHHHRSPELNRRDQVLLLVGWAAALRSSELVALDVDDIDFTGNPDNGTGGGMLVRVRHSKTDQTANNAFVEVPYTTSAAWCPVRYTMLHVRHIRTGALFRNFDRHTKGRRLGDEAISRILKQHITNLLDQPADLYSSHSLRAGYVTEARAHHIPDHLIARHTRHKDLRMLGVYDRPADLFNDPAFNPDWW